MRKLFAAVVIITSLLGCSLSSTQKASLLSAAGTAAYSAAEMFYQTTAQYYDEKDRRVYEMWLSAFKLALDTGGSILPYVQRWDEFTGRVGEKDAK
jgi:hypothetical protein